MSSSFISSICRSLGSGCFRGLPAVAGSSCAIAPPSASARIAWNLASLIPSSAQACTTLFSAAIVSSTSFRRRFASRDPCTDSTSFGPFVFLAIVDSLRFCLPATPSSVIGSYPPDAEEGVA